MHAEGESDHFHVRCDHIVQPVPLQVVDNDAELKKQLVHNRVVVFELEEITMTEEEERIMFEEEEALEGRRSRVSIGLGSRITAEV